MSRYISWYAPVLLVVATAHGCQNGDAAETPVALQPASESASIGESAESRADERVIPEITQEDLDYHARGLRAWIVEIDEVPEGKILCLAFLDHLGTIESRGFHNVKKGDRVKVVLSGLSEENLDYSLVTEGMAHRSSIPNYFHDVHGPTITKGSSAPLKPGDLLIRKVDFKFVNATGTGPAPQKGEIAIALVFQDRPSKRRDYAPINRREAGRR